MQSSKSRISVKKANETYSPQLLSVRLATEYIANNKLPEGRQSKYHIPWTILAASDGCRRAVKMYNATIVIKYNGAGLIYKKSPFSTAVQLFSVTIHTK